MFLCPYEKNSGIHKVRFPEIFLAIRHVVGRREIAMKYRKIAPFFLFATFQLVEYVTSFGHHQKYSMFPSQLNFLIRLVIAAE